MKSIITSALFCFVLTTISCNKCTNPQLQTVSVLVEIADRFFNFIHSVVTKSDDFKKSVKEIYLVTNRSIEEKKDVKTIALFWEKYWEKIQIKYEALHSELDALHAQADEYFMVLAENNAKMNDPELKKQDQMKNQTLRTKWEVEYKAAVVGLAEAGIILNTGNDFLLVLKNSVLREEIEKQMPQLVAISNQAELLSSKINLFEIRTKTIFNYSK